MASTSSSAVLEMVTARTSTPGHSSTVSAAENATSGPAGATRRLSRQSSQTATSSSARSNARSTFTFVRWSPASRNAGAATT